MPTTYFGHCIQMLSTMEYSIRTVMLRYSTFCGGFAHMLELVSPQARTELFSFS